MRTNMCAKMFYWIELAGAERSAVKHCSRTLQHHSTGNLATFVKSGAGSPSYNKNPNQPLEKARKMCDPLSLSDGILKGSAKCCKI